MKKIKLWDVPLRIFHWSLVVLVAGAFITGQIGGGLMEWHGRIGAAIAALLGFRLTWGLFGSTYARFTTFIKGPTSIRAFLKGEWNGMGHNPLGALSVVGMLGVLLLQVTTGLFANDDIAFQGPYNVLASKNTEVLAIYLHKRIYWLIAIMVGLHLGAIAYYTRVKGENLITAMVTGNKEVPATQKVEDARGGGPLALVVALIVAAAAAWVAVGGPVQYLVPPPPPAVETPNW